MSKNLDPVLREAFSSHSVLASIEDGLYVTDTDRKIIFWNDSAERITGWKREEVVGRGCRDQILCHIDKDGRSLCGKEHCPLHRSIVTGEASKVPVIIYANSRSGKRIPMHVSTSPLRDAKGEVVGGVEVFRDMTHAIGDIQRAKRIQAASLTCDTSENCAFKIETHYVPQDIVGGDYFAFAETESGGVAGFVADVMGHGTASALYTMFFSLLWSESSKTRTDPATFLTGVDKRIHPLLEEGNYFATGIGLNLDPVSHTIRYAGAGHPSPIILRKDGSVVQLDCSALPLGLLGEGQYENHLHEFKPGDVLLLYTDGAVELELRDKTDLETEGLARIARELLDSRGKLCPRELEVELLRVSNCVRYNDDITLITIAYRES